MLLFPGRRELVFPLETKLRIQCRDAQEQADTAQQLKVHL